MRRLGVERVVSADREFDGVPGVIRLDPVDIDEWRDSVLATEVVTEPRRGPDSREPRAARSP